MSDTGAAPIESVDRALRLVMLLRDEESLSLTDAAERLGVPPSTAHRLMSALLHRQFAVRDHGRRYRAGPALAGRRREGLAPEAVGELLRPAVQQLHERVGETSQLMVREGALVRYLYGIEPDQPLRVTARSGDTMPAHVAAGGKAMLATLADDELDALYPAGLPSWSTARVADLPALKRELSKVRRQGFGANIEETERGVCGLAVAVRSPADEAVAALVVAVPSVRFQRRDVPQYVEGLNAARELGEAALPLG